MIWSFTDFSLSWISGQQSFKNHRSASRLGRWAGLPMNNRVSSLFGSWSGSEDPMEKYWCCSRFDTEYFLRAASESSLVGNTAKSADEIASCSFRLIANELLADAPSIPSPKLMRFACRSWAQYTTGTLKSALKFRARIIVLSWLTTITSALNLVSASSRLGFSTKKIVSNPIRANESPKSLMAREPASLSGSIGVSWTMATFNSCFRV